MRTPFLTGCAIVIDLAAAFASQTDKPKPPKKWDTVVIRGCLRGSAVEGAEMSTLDAEGEQRHEDQVPVLTYRLQGKKDVLNALREKHDRKVVEVKGILRTDLSASSGIGRDVGRTRITVGVDPRTARSQGADQVIPVLEATSFEGTSESCGK